MATLTRQTITDAGLTVAMTSAAGGGDKAPIGAGTFLVVRNSGGSPITVTIDDPTSQNPGAAKQFNPDNAVSVPATTGEKWIPLGTRYRGVADGLAAITYSGVTGLSVACVQAS